MKCKAKNLQTGKRCKGPALPSGFCFGHDPTKKAERSRAQIQRYAKERIPRVVKRHEDDGAPELAEAAMSITQGVAILVRAELRRMLAW